MSDGSGVSGAVAALDRLDAARAAIFDLNLTGCSRDEVLEVCRRLEADSRRRESFDHDLLAHVTERGIAGDLSVSNTRALLVSLLRITPADASRRVRAATELGPRQAIVGEVLEPQFPAVAAAQRDGAISGEHAAVITRSLIGLPDPIRSATFTATAPNRPWWMRPGPSIRRSWRKSPATSPPSWTPTGCGLITPRKIGGGTSQSASVPTGPGASPAR